jgi:uncharacterized membrane protein
MVQLNFDIKQNHSNWVIIAVILLAASIRLPNLSVQSIAFDESFSLVVGLADWSTLFGAILSDGVHPPLFYVIHKGALALWGTSEFGQRFLAAAFSLVSVPLVYWSGTVLFNRNVGLLGALLLALNPLHVWLAQEARMYSMLSVLAIISMIVFWQAIRIGRRRYWVALAVVNSMIFLIHYFGFLIPTVQFLFIVATFRHNYRYLRPWTLTQIIACLPLLPWLAATVMRQAQTFGIGFLVRPSVPDFLITLWNLTLGSSNLFWPISLVAISIIVVTVVLALRPLAPHNVELKQARLLVALWGFLPLLITWLVSQRRSFYADRYLSLAIPGLLLLLAFSALRLHQRPWRQLLVAGLIVASGYGLLITRIDPAFQKDDWRAVAAYIDHHQQADEVILLYTTHIKYVFDYYYRGGTSTTPISLNLDNFPLEPLTDGHRRVWIVYPYTRRPTHYPMQPLMPDGFWHNDPERNPYLVDWLETHTDDIIDYEHFRGIELWLVDQGEKEE